MYVKKARVNNRQANSNIDDNELNPKLPADTPTLHLFKDYQVELDFRHDKHERIVKLSRDITIESKRVIFQLQRIPGSSSSSCDGILHNVFGKLEEIINNKFYMIAEELKTEDSFQFLRAYSPGLQEFIEAMSLYHYQKDKHLVTFTQIQQMLDFSSDVNIQTDANICDVTEDNSSENRLNSADCNESSDSNIPLDSAEPSICIDTGHRQRLFVNVPLLEYVLGICDLTGELMRLAITHVSKGDLDTPFELCKFLREVYNIFTAFGYINREFSKKVSIINQSLVKVENACYNLQVRGSEVPKHMLADMFTSQTETEILEDHDI